MQEQTGGAPAATQEPMKLDVSVRLIDPVKNLIGFASVKFNDCFVVENFKILQGEKGIYAGMPSQPDLHQGTAHRRGKTGGTGAGGEACKDKGQPWTGQITSGHGGPK